MHPTSSQWNIAPPFVVVFIGKCNPRQLLKTLALIWHCCSSITLPNSVVDVILTRPRGACVLLANNIVSLRLQRSSRLLFCSNSFHVPLNRSKISQLTYYSWIISIFMDSKWSWFLTRLEARAVQSFPLVTKPSNFMGFHFTVTTFLQPIAAVILSFCNVHSLTCRVWWCIF